MSEHTPAELQTSSPPSAKQTLTPEALLYDWLSRIGIAQISHYQSEAHFDGRNLAFGVPVLVVTTLVGTSVFATLAKEAVVWVKIVIGIMSVLAAIMSALQTFLRYSERAARHREAAVKYSKLRREIEQQLAFGFGDDLVRAKFVDSVRQRWDAINEESPDAPQKIFLRIYKERRGENAPKGNHNNANP